MELWHGSEGFERCAFLAFKEIEKSPSPDASKSERI
jgi:hypothetical protein